MKTLFRTCLKTSRINKTQLTTKLSQSFTANDKTNIKVIPEVKSTDQKYGNLLDIGRMGGFHFFLKHYHEKLGPIFYFWVNQDRVVSLGHPKYWRAVSHLSDKSDKLRLFLKPLFGTEKTINLANGEERSLRYQKYITPFVSKDVIENKHSIVIERRLKDLMANIDKVKEHVPVQHHFSLYIMKNMFELLFGIKEFDDKEIGKLFEYLTFSVINIEIQTLNDKLTPELSKEIQEKITYVHKFLKKAIHDRLNSDVSGFECLMDLLRGPNDEEVIFTDTSTFFFGSIHTTVTTSSLTLYHLATNPDKQEKLQEELDKVFKDKPINMKTIKDLKYLRACINEALRITPPVSTSSRIDNENDIELPDGYVIPKKTTIATPLALVLTSPDLWNHPEKYSPERFKEDGLKWPNQYSPFGFAGGRVCPGKNLALLEIQLMLASLFKKYKVSLAKSQGPLQLHILTGTTIKEDFYIDLKPRSSI